MSDAHATDVVDVENNENDMLWQENFRLQDEVTELRTMLAALLSPRTLRLAL